VSGRFNTQSANCDKTDWELVWHGCFVSRQDYNDLAALKDGGFIVTHPATLRTPGDTLNWQGKRSPISGVSVAIKLGTAIYLGTFQGDRIVKPALER
jgi:hypothetical protein